MLTRLRWQRYALLVVVILFSGLLLAPALAPATDLETDELPYQVDSLEEVKQLEEQRKENESQIKALEKEIKQTQSTIDALMVEIAELDVQMQSLSLEINASQAAVDALDLRIDAAIQAIDDATVRLQERQAYLESRVRDSYINGQITFLDVFFEAASFDEFIMLYDNMERLMVADRELVDAIYQERALIEDEKLNLEVSREAQQQILLSLEDQHTALDELTSRKEQAVTAAENQKESAEAQQQDLELANATAEAVIKDFYARNPESSRSFGGSMQWPLPADQTRITSEYGMRNHPILGGQRMHAGLDVGAPNGTQIYAATAGEIIFRGWNGGYGNCIIVDHGTDSNGNSISTLYAHMSGYGSFGVGDLVSSSDVIGYVGSTGQSTGNHLHFEVRVNGAHTNPRPYLGI